MQTADAFALCLASLCIGFLMGVGCMLAFIHSPKRNGCPGRTRVWEDE